MDRKLVIGLVLGFIIGGFAVGLLDAYRPQPLFSSAMMENSNTRNGNSNTGGNVNGRININR